MKAQVLLLFLCISLFACNLKKPGMGDLTAQLDVEPTIAMIDQTRDTMIIGKEGTVIFFEKNSLVFDDGSLPTSPVQVNLKEYYDKGKIVSQPLTTLTSDGKLLKSGGMIDLNATSDARHLQIKKGKEIILQFPKNGNKEKMKMFSGQKDENGNVVWNEEKTDQRRLKDDLIIWYTKYEGIDVNRLYQSNGNDFYDWIRDNLQLTASEQDYFLYKDIRISYTISKNGEMHDVHFKKKIRKSIANRLLKIMKTVPLLKPYTVNGHPIDMPGWLQLRVKVTPPKYANNKSYLAAIKQKAILNKGKTLNTLSKIELHYYVFNSNKMGTINCDKFVNDPGAKVSIVVNVEDATDDMVKFVFKEYKSFVAGKYDQGKYHFSNIPEGKEITLMVLRYQGGKALVGFKEFISAEMEIANVPLQEMSLEELDLELSKLN